MSLPVRWPFPLPRAMRLAAAAVAVVVAAGSNAVLAGSRLEVLGGVTLAYADLDGRWPTAGGTSVQRGGPAFSIAPAAIARLENPRLSSWVSLRASFLIRNNGNEERERDGAYDARAGLLWKATEQDHVAFSAQYDRDVPRTGAAPAFDAAATPIDDEFAIRSEACSLHGAWDRLIDRNWKLTARLAARRQWIAGDDRLPGTERLPSSDALDFNVELLRTFTARIQAGGLITGSRHQPARGEPTDLAGAGLSGALLLSQRTTLQLTAALVALHQTGRARGKDVTFSAKLLTDVREGQLVLEVRRRFWDPLGAGQPQRDDQIQFTAPWINVPGWSLMTTWSAHWLRETRDPSGPRSAHLTAFNASFTKQLWGVLHLHAALTARAIRIGSSAETRTGRERIATAGLIFMPVRGVRTML